MKMVFSRKASAAALSVVFVCFLVLVSLTNRNIGDTSAISTRSFSLTETARRVLHQNFNLNWVSRRKVPDGPDPIHNRREGKTRLPPR